MTARLRLAVEEDAPAAAASLEEMARRIRRTCERWPWLVLDDDGGVAGYAYAGPHRERAAYGWSVDTTVYVAPAFHRRGVGRALHAALLPVLAHQGYYKAFAGITLPNAGSVALREAVGFERVGVRRGVGYRLGAWHDVAWYQRALRPEGPAPEPPRAVTELIGTQAWEAALAAGLRAHGRAGRPGPATRP